MPIAVNNLTAVIKFTVPNSRLDHNPSRYLEYDPNVTRPTEEFRLPVQDLRNELDSEGLAGPGTQLDQRGFAVMKHESKAISLIPTEEGTNMYLAECVELMKSQLGCTKVIAWNSVVRMNDPHIDLKVVPKQPGPEKGFVPTSRIQPIAGTAHVDQDEVWGHELCGKALGQPSDTFKRVQIVNIWRPLHGPVTNAPLAMLDYRYLPQEDVSKHASQFGVGLDIHYSAQQRWAYIRHQMSDEIIFLKCYDSMQGKDGSALYCGHVAVQVDGDAEGIPEELIRPRESIEVRLVAAWE